MTDDQMNPEEQDARFAERVSGPLRKQEALDQTFEARLMSAVHADARDRSAGRAAKSWRHRRTFAISPLAGLAIAAGVGAILVGVGVAIRPALDARMRTEVVSSFGSGRTDTVYMVRFVLMDSSAQAVSVIGDFNSWTKDATPLTRSGVPGMWVVSYPVPAGRHEYAFVVDGSTGERWVADPNATVTRDEFGTESSVVRVGPTATKSDAETK